MADDEKVLRSKQKHLVQTSGEVKDAEGKEASRSPSVQLNYPAQEIDNLDLTHKDKMFPFDSFGMKKDSSFLPERTSLHNLFKTCKRRRFACTALTISVHFADLTLASTLGTKLPDPSAVPQLCNYFKSSFCLFFFFFSPVRQGSTFVFTT